MIYDCHGHEFCEIIRPAFHPKGDLHLHNHHRFFFRLSVFASILALFVIVLGAYTRLTHAGLGCPDWPGCYGHALAPTAVSQIDVAKSPFPLELITPDKAWTEMVHRYFAFTLATLTVLIAFFGLWRALQQKQNAFVPLALIACIIFQALLGKWTVTWKLLPAIVMGHLLGGLVVLSLLWTQALILLKPRLPQMQSFSALRLPVLIALLLVFFQIALGGWVSSNYAAIICPHFPMCDQTLIPPLDFKHAFNLFVPIGINYYGGNLDYIARVTIQMTHRYGAFVIVTYLSLLGLWLISSRTVRRLRPLGLLILLLLAIQFSLGVLNVVWVLPLPIAVAHNGFAALLLLTLVTLNFVVFSQKDEAILD
jgi:cytochrome c oxidase assembly protein subunit 15